VVEQNTGMNLLPENIVNLRAISTDSVQLPLISNAGILLDVLRLDKIDPIISGNKWFKLQYYLAEALAQGKKRLLTFGGAYSNHIIATACAAQRAGLTSTGIIRGEKPARLSHTLLEAAQYGMQLVFISREQYQKKSIPAFIEQLRHEYGDACIIPEGGEGPQGIKGAATILDTVDGNAYTDILCAAGTGTLLSGLAVSAAAHQRVTGIPVLKGFDDWTPATSRQNTHIINNYHFGGYAKKNGTLIDFMNEWYLQTGIPSDFVYTGKLFYGVMDLIEKGFFPEASSLLVIHSGGLQGNNSLPAKTLFF
jgi:1-aminocyclopropane-1-carboxylate deaminase